MRRIRIRLRLKFYPFLWSLIIIVSVYLLVRFAILSFSEDMGQASFSEALVSKLCSSVLESGASLVGYTAKEDGTTNSLMLGLVKDNLAISAFAEEETETSDLLQTVSSNNTYNLPQAAVEVEAVNTNKDYIEGLQVYEIDSNSLGREYIMTNGAVLRSSSSGTLLGDEELITNQLNIGYLKGDISQQSVDESEESDEAVETSTASDSIEYTMKQLNDIKFLISHFYVVDASTKVTNSLFNAEDFLNKDMTIKQSNDAPQILIYHTHSQEAFADSKPGEEEDTVVGVGSYLTKILENDYGYNVIHDKTQYDVIGGDRNLAYNVAEDSLTKTLKENPSIEVIIDLHRNSGDGKTITVDGRDTAMVMLFNGLSRDQDGPITYLENPYQQDNLAFSFQLQLKANKLYPGLFKKNYLKSYRFNMHFRPKSLLIELGTVNNTVESEKNAMIPFAEILDDVLKGN